MGAAGFRGSWSAVFPDCGGMLFDLRNLRLDNGKKITFNGGILLLFIILACGIS